MLLCRFICRQECDRPVVDRPNSGLPSDALSSALCLPVSAEEVVQAHRRRGSEVSTACCLTSLPIVCFVWMLSSRAMHLVELPDGLAFFVISFYVELFAVGFSKHLLCCVHRLPCLRCLFRMSCVAPHFFKKCGKN